MDLKIKVGETINERQVKEREMDTEFFLNYTLYLLTNFYSHFNPNADECSFLRDIYFPYLDDENASGLSLSDHYQNEKEKQPIDMANSAMRISCAYCAQAERELEINREVAWVYISQATYWCGMATSGLGLALLTFNDFKKEIRTVLARESAQGRVKKTLPLKAEIYRLIIEKCPSPNGWPSRNAAAQAIEFEAIEFAKQKEITFSEDRAVKTLNEWLKQMPDNSKYFPTSGA